MAAAPDDPTVACSYCGAANAAGAPACALCGSPLPTRVAAPDASAPPATAIYPPAPSPATTVYPPAAPPPATAIYPPPGPAAQAPPGAGYPPPAAPLPARPVRGGRRGLWLGCALGLVAGLCLAGLLGVGTLLVVRQGVLFPTPTATPVDPTALLDSAIALQEQQKAVHYVLTGEFEGNGNAQTPQNLTIEGDVAPPDSYTMHTSNNGDRVVIGPDVYVKPQGAPAWQRAPGAPPPGTDVLPNPTTLLSFDKYYAPGSVALGRTVISGTEHLQQVRFAVDLQQMAASEGPGSLGQVLLGSQVQGTVLIAESSQQITRMTLLIVTPSSGTATLTLDLSRFGVPVQITPPPGVGQ